MSEERNYSHIFASGVIPMGHDHDYSDVGADYDADTLGFQVYERYGVQIYNAMGVSGRDGVSVGYVGKSTVEKEPWTFEF